MDRSQLEQTLRRLNPAVRLVSEHHFRRAVQRLQVEGERVGASADWPLWVRRATAEAYSALPPDVTAGPEEVLLVLPEPMERVPDSDLLRNCWRRLFRATALQAVGKTVGRWRQLDEAVRVEAEFYLSGEGVLPSDPTDADKYAAFAAEFVTLARFAPNMLRYAFPAADHDRTLALIRTDFDDASAFHATKPDGAEPPAETELSHGEVVTPAVPTSPEPAAPLRAEAARAERVRNDVRAAILLAKAAEALPEHEGAARVVVAEKLVPRLAGVFGWDAETQRQWTDALVPLLRPAGRRYWSPAATALYELQKLAIDLSADLYAVDPAGWARSFGRRPVLRKLSLARRSLLLQGLWKVQKRLVKAPLEVAHREAVESLLNVEIEAADAALRGGVEPKLRDALHAAGLVPTNVPEEVGRDKLVAELLDLLCERGHLRLADLRDAVARNRLKMPDLSGVGEWFRGDTLLRADALLADQLDGLYHRGEIYLRWIQRASAAAFGSRYGRAVTLYFLLPFLASVMVVEFSKYLAHEARTVYKFVSRLVRTADEPPAITAVEEAASAVAGADVEAAEEAVKATAALTGAVPHAVQGHAHGHGPLVTPASATAIVLLTLIFLGLIHWPAFRSLVFSLFRWLWAAVKFACYTGPLWVWRSPPVRAVRSNAVSRFITARFGWAIVSAAAVMAFLLVFGASVGRVERWTALTFAFVALALNTSFGRRWQDGCEEFVARCWRAVWVDVLPGLVSFVSWAFHELLGMLDRWLYTIDEWFRFRPGESKPSLALKVILGVVWFPIAYVVRFAFYLLIEPQVNPLKHFPVVTVSHKLLLPMIPSLSQSTGLSLEAVGGVVWGIPGIFGFMVWELKENWRLYAANRPDALTPVPLGHHGETMRGLLRPGFHSGTVPAAFRKIRRAVAKAERRGRVADVSKPLDALHHVEHALAHFVERELFAVLNAAECWRGLHPEVGAVRLGLQDITVDVRVPGLSPDPVRLGFARIDDDIRFRVERGGFLDRLTLEQREVWEQAALGLSAMGATGQAVNWMRWVAFWQDRREQPPAEPPAATSAHAPGTPALR